MEELKLCESDHRFMNIIWDHEPLSSGKLVSLCLEILGWKKSTTYTMLKRLCERGLVQNENGTVSSLAARDDVRAFESERIVERTFGGSLPGFLAAFLGGKTISDEEAAELKRLIDEHREG
ncbi:MAG: BlaI/MecI/CopY family transcriptional regulator [Oscillospiraceae bacterium]|nr:BlaI/MecI/CopY family transcriptional regulator [Oscillospiraceae bacterium]